MRDIVLPAFELDCRDWLVLTPSAAGVPDEVGGSPLLAVLSTAVIGTDSFRSANGILTLGLLDDDVAMRQVAPGSVAAQLLGDDVYTGDSGAEMVRYVLPTPGGNLALLAEFTTPDGNDDEVGARIEALMRSFRWAA